MYKVIKFFHDLEDKKETKNGAVYHAYDVGDTYPRKGLKPSNERITELLGSENKQGEPLIEQVEENKEEDHPKTTRKRTSKKVEE